MYKLAYELKQSTWQVSGLVQGALKNAADFNLKVEEAFPGDPWIASLGGKLSDAKFKLLINNYSLDPDGNGKPFYFIAKKDNGPQVVYFQGKGLMSLMEAKKFGAKMGLAKEQLDFKSRITS